MRRNRCDMFPVIILFQSLPAHGFSLVHHRALYLWAAGGPGEPSQLARAIRQQPRSGMRGGGAPCLARSPVVPPSTPRRGSRRAPLCAAATRPHPPASGQDHQPPHCPGLSLSHRQPLDKTINPSSAICSVRYKALSVNELINYYALKSMRYVSLSHSVSITSNSRTEVTS